MVNRNIEQPELISRKTERVVEGVFIFYILRCCDGSYYCGSTNNLKRRLRDHQSGNGCSWTSKRLPVELVYHENHLTLVEVRKRESQVKGWTRAKKEKLIKGTWKKISL
jgi:predicted GIY-YIG superfamily endonuclease